MPPRTRQERRLGASLPLRLITAAILLYATHGPAFAQGAQTSCSQTVGVSAAAVPFPASGNGPSSPSTYLEMCNAHATNNLGVNWTGGTAAIGAIGTLTLFPGGCMWWTPPMVPPPALSVVGSAAGTTTACAYR